MTSLVIGHQASAALAHHTVLLLRARHHPFNGIADLVVAHFGELATGRKDGGFVEKVGEIGTGVTRCPACNLVEIDVLGEGLAASVNTKNL